MTFSRQAFYYAAFVTTPFTPVQPGIRTFSAPAYNQKRTKIENFDKLATKPKLLYTGNLE